MKIKEILMNSTQNSLKSLALAGVEWELNEVGCKKKDPAIPYAPRAPHDEHRTAAPIDNPEPARNFSTPKASAPIAGADILEAAKKLAAEDDIFAAIKRFTIHPLFAGAKNTVPPVLPVNPPLLVVTDIPSLADDASGQILSGPEGELFDKMMLAIGLARDKIALTPLVFWRPAGGRAPTADEIAFTKPFIDKIIALAKPKKILTLGACAAREIAGAVLPRDHGKIFGNVIPIYKPDFILQNPSVKKDVWEALKVVIRDA
jgi:DNA polymerase